MDEFERIVRETIASWGEIPAGYGALLDSVVAGLREKRAAGDDTVIHFAYASALFQYTEYRERKVRSPKRHAELAISVGLFHALYKWGVRTECANVSPLDFANLDQIPPTGWGPLYRQELLWLDTARWIPLQWGYARMPREDYRRMFGLS